VVTPDGLTVAAADGSASTLIVPGTTGRPSWSPAGDRIAYVAGSDPGSIRVVNPDGSANVRVVARYGPSSVGPVWSPDGSRLAFFVARGGASVTVAHVDGGPSVTYPVPAAYPDGRLDWPRPGLAIYTTGQNGMIAIAVPAGGERTLPVPDAAFSPDGSRLAYEAGGECRDRDGIYVADADGTHRHRVTNSCRVVGTSGPDVLHGSFSQVVLGLGGDDTLYADDTYYFFDGDTLYGGAGNDTLVGGYGQDILYGGPGDDVLFGGPSADVLVGGPGRDRIYGGGGGDTIYAADGERDWIDCGKNGYGRAGRDVVYADRVDVVASDCEIVHRS